MKEGYKKTELGWMPEEWNIVNLESISELITKGTTPSTYGFEFVDKGVNFLKIENISGNGRIDVGNLLKISKDCNDKLKRSQMKTGDILFSIAGSLGKTLIVDESILPCNTNQALSIIRLKDIVNKEFIKEFLSSNYVTSFINKISTIGAQPNVSLKQVGDIKIILPTLKEQKKIAEILSTVDSQIDDTDKLIEKTKELKKGLMQRLLTKGIGHSEFKKSEVGEIPVEWEVKELNNISTIVDSLHETPNYVDSGYSMIRVVDVNGKAINTDSAFKVTEETYLKFIRKYEPQSGDIIMSRVGSYGLVSYLKDNEKVCLGQNIVVITTKLMDKSFLFYCLSSEYIKNEINKLTVGSSQKTLSLANINKLHVALPTIIEQKQIANILLSVDDQIEEYENKKIKLEQLKQGLMQQLLTGKIRVK